MGLTLPFRYLATSSLTPPSTMHEFHGLRFGSLRRTAPTKEPPFAGARYAAPRFPRRPARSDGDGKTRSWSVPGMAGSQCLPCRRHTRRHLRLQVNAEVATLLALLRSAGHLIFRAVGRPVRSAPSMPQVRTTRGATVLNHCPTKVWGAGSSCQSVESDLVGHLVPSTGLILGLLSGFYGGVVSFVDPARHGSAAGVPGRPVGDCHRGYSPW